MAERELQHNEELVPAGTAPRLWRWKVTDSAQENSVQIVLKGEKGFQYCALQHRHLDFAQQAGPGELLYRFSDWQDVPVEFLCAI